MREPISKSVWFMLGVIVGLVISTLIFQPVKNQTLNRDLVLGVFLIPGSCPVDGEFISEMSKFAKLLKENSRTQSNSLTRMYRIMEPTSITRVEGIEGLAFMIPYYERCVGRWKPQSQ